MPNWKKLIVSGSDANLNSLNIATDLTGSNALITNDLDVLGNVGIGTTSPSYKLEVDGTFLASGNSTIQGRTDLQKDLIIRGTDALANQGVARFYVDSSNNLFIDTANDGANLFTIKGTNGNVGIGTTNPSYALDVSGSLNNIARLNSSTTKSQLLFVDSDSTDTVAIGSQGDDFHVRVDNGNIKFQTNSGATATTRMIVNSSGNVGIGTTSPDAKLDVDGDVQVKGVNISNQENLDVDTGTETVATVAIADYDAAFFEYVVKNGTDLRAGIVTAVHNGTSVEFTETSTQDLGNTTRLTLSVDISGTDMRLRATATSDNWEVKTLVRAI